MKKRLLSAALTLCMFLSLLPAAAFATEEPTPITWIYLDGLTMPVGGSVPQYTLRLRDADAPYHLATKAEMDAAGYKYTDQAVNGMWWGIPGINGYLSPTDTFTTGTPYKATIVLFCEPGYTFTDRTTTIIDGDPSPVGNFRNYGSIFVILTDSFTATDPAAGPTIIEEINLNLPENPKHDEQQSPYQENDPEKPYTAEGTWFTPDGEPMDPDSIFIGGKYTLHVKLTPREGYVFADGLSYDQQSLTISPDGTASFVKTYLVLPTQYSMATVTFKVENGTWADTGTTEKTKAVELFDGIGTLDKKLIPTDMRPIKGYGNGAWDTEPNTSKDAITGDVTYTYRFSQKAGYTIISAVEATSNLQERIQYGNQCGPGSLHGPEFTVTSGNSVEMDRFGIGTRYEKWNEDSGTWEICEGNMFTEGTYRYRVQVFARDTEDRSFVLSDQCSVKVDGQDWGILQDIVVTEDNLVTWGYVYSPAITVTKPAGNLMVEYPVTHLRLVTESKVIEEVEKLTGIVGEMTDMQAKDYPGYHLASEIEQYVIYADCVDGYTIFYEKNIHNLTWELGGGTPSGDYTAAGEVPYSTVIVPPTVTREGFLFDGWSDAYTVGMQMPDHDLTITARWKIDWANHTDTGTLVAGKAPTCTADGFRDYYQCICGKFFEDEACTREIPNLAAWKSGAGKLEKTGHTVGEWQKNATNHWHECRCGEKLDVGAHNFVWIIDREATETKAGAKHQHCTVCGYNAASVTIPAIKVPTKTVEKVEIKPLNTVPEGLKNTEFDTVEKINQAMEDIVLKKMGEQNTGNEPSTMIYDLVQKITVNGVTRPATRQEIEEIGKITVVIPYPAGTNKEDYVFTAARMLTMDIGGMHAGDIETPQITLTDDGLQLTLKGLSPVMLGYSKKVETPTPTDSTTPETTAPTTPATTDPTTPATTDPTKSDSSAEVNTPQTGNGSNVLLWTLLVLVTACVIGGIVWFKKKRNSKK